MIRRKHGVEQILEEKVGVVTQFSKDFFFVSHYL